jgi:transcriptional regulator with XRE-family HTH domain
MELKKYRRIAGLTQEQLARKSGVDATLISRLERGDRRRLSYDNIVRLARALNLEPEELVPVPEKIRKAETTPPDALTATRGATTRKDGRV